MKQQFKKIDIALTPVTAIAAFCATQTASGLLAGAAVGLAADCWDSLGREKSINHQPGPK